MPPPLPPLVRVAHLPAGSSERRELERAVHAGNLVRVHAGVFADAREWAALDHDSRHLLGIRAAVPHVHSRYVVSHESALALHGVSCLRPWPPDVHITDPLGGRGCRHGRVIGHAGPLDPSEVEVVDGIRCTSLLRTCVDLAWSRSFEVAVAAADECLRRKLITPDRLRQEFESRETRRGRASAARALAFANANSDSGGESWCRCRLSELGTPVPVQQQEFSDGRGFIAFVDFWFPDHGVIVEFDGDQKYMNPRFSRGLTPAEIVANERKRERRLLALSQVREVVRVEWRDIVDPWRLRSLLVIARVPVRK